MEDIKLGEGVAILTDSDELIASIVIPAMEVEEEEEEEEEDVLFEELAEPEVIEKGKKEEEEFED